MTFTQYNGKILSHIFYTSDTKESVQKAQALIYKSVYKKV